MYKKRLSYYLESCPGTSLDGIDVVEVHFFYSDKWNFKIRQATTVTYTKEWFNCF